MRKTDNIWLWFVLVLVYFGILFAIYQLPFMHENPTVDILISIVFVLATIRPLRRWMRGSLIKIFNPEYFENNQRIKQLKHKLQITQPHEEIIKTVLHELEDIFDARIIAIVLRENSNYTIVRYIAPKPINLDNVSIDMNSEMMKTIREKGQIVRIDRQALRYNPTPQRQADYRFKDYKLFNYAIPLKVKDAVTGAILTSNLPYDFIRDWENGLLEDFAEYLGILLHNSQLYYEVRWEALQKNTLYEISKRITSSLDITRVLRSVIDSLNEVVDYSAAGIFLVRDNQNIVREMVQRGYADNNLDRVNLKVGQGVVGRCIRERRPIIVGDVDEDPNYVKVRPETRSEMCVPIYNHNKKNVIGAFNIESDKPNTFSKSNLDRLTAFAEQVSIAIENANLYRQAKQSKRYKRDIEVAKEIQNAFLPKKLPQDSKYDFAAICEPSQDVGGDFYDVQQLSHEKIGIAIGDVSGKGVPGAMLMANLYAGYRSRLRTEDSIKVMVTQLNELLVESTNSEKYATFFYGELDRDSHEFTYCNAGHNPPLLIHENGDYEELNTGGPVVGVLENAVYEESTIRFRSGDLLLLYTDGITEARNLKGQYYEVGRLMDVVQRRENHMPSDELIDMIHRDVYEFTRGESPQDDVTVIVIQLRNVEKEVAETA